ncbi:MAG: protein translocase SEC61 complex subunit gamma [Candidatus Nitrosotalea sp.]|nr:protein translocase SEC61 complex subunit gamma [Candidatus Nitrosotalea sp.]
MVKINPKQMLKDMVNTMKLAKKSDKEDYMEHLRLVSLGMATLGAIGFIIQFTFAVINLGHR